ncbi:MAG: protein-L-isoaspartate O-methyltransferase, partial [Deltaproteobacteria bacterium]|nr:protein-L-isoaspartate O-methyltransferase [Deltaproteobacteria bacterium]
SLAEQAKERLEKLNFKRVKVKTGDGYAGWPEAAPFDGVILTAAPPHIPEPLKNQIRVGGRLVAPVGVEWQSLVVLHRVSADRWVETRDIPVRFVPMRGRVEREASH